jgi:AcrR family transcriptional regulator
LIDAHGVAALSMRELSDALGVYPSAIYWHVPNRDALVSGTVAWAMEGAVIGIGSGPWQERIRRLLVRFRQALRRHPNLAPVVASELVYNSSHDPVLLDQVVGALEDAGFKGATLVDAFNVVIAGMCGFATLELARVPGDDKAAWEKSCRERIDSIDADRHPALGRHMKSLKNKAFILRWSSGETSPLDRSFDAWIDVLIQGLEALSAKDSPRR